MARGRRILGIALGILLLDVSGFEFDAIGHDSLKPNQVITLNWRPSDNRKIELWLYRMDDGHFSSIGDFNNIGAYTWTVPTDVELNEQYEFVIVDHKNEDDYAFSDMFRIEDTSSHTSSSSSSTTTTTSKSKSTSTQSTSTSTSVAISATETSSSDPTTIPATSATETAPAATTTYPTVIVSGFPPSPIPTPIDMSTSGIPSSTKVALIVCLVLGVPLVLLALLFWYFTRRHPPDTNDTTGSRLVAFIQWLFRRGYPQPGPIHQPIMSEEAAAEKGVRDVSDMSEFSSSPAISQGVRSSLATQNTELWHYKPELPGSDPLRESSVQFLPPVELPAWTPEELDSSVKDETTGKGESHARTENEGKDPPGPDEG